MRNALFSGALAAAVSLSTLNIAAGAGGRGKSNPATGPRAHSGVARTAGAVPTAPSLALVNGRQLMVRRRNPDGSLGLAAPYTIKGVDWSPASRGTNTSPTDPNNANVRRPEFASWAATDIPLLKGMNVNTVRLFIDPGVDATGRAVLDQLYDNDIMVIMTVDDAVNNLSRVQQAVNFYKDHPAILMWSLGSEWNINRYFGVASSVRDAAQRTENAAALIKSLDTNHPVATSYGEININQTDLRLTDTGDYVNNICHSVDVWGLNIYRGNSFGILFEQWQSITGKPLFLGEFGTDAFRVVPSSTTLGSVDELMQAHWDASLWNDLAKNLSAVNPSKFALGGLVFASNDEWWKVSPAGSQQVGGFSLPQGHPDNFANEEWFGLFDIDRIKRQVYDSLKAVFAPGSQLNRTVTFRAASRGARAKEFPSQLGLALFFRGGDIFHRTEGGGQGGRGFNVAVVDPVTGDLLHPVRNFDTYASRSDGAAMRAMIDFLNSLPDGVLVLIAVGDEAGLNGFETCDHLSFTWTEDTYRALEGLGSRQIRNYCYWDSWTMAAFKGQGQAVEERLGTAVEVSAVATVSLSSTLRFSAAAAEVSENAGAVQLTVTRSGDLTNESEVSYQTINQTADDRSDYMAALGTLRFAPGEHSKTVTVAITNDVRVEPVETFGLALSNPAGASLGAPSAATVTINSEDAAPPAPADNPINEAAFFVRQHYRDFLNREPDPSGLAFWTGQITECESRPPADRQACHEVRRINVSAAFFLSIEFQQTGYLVYRTYGAAFGTRRIGGTVPLTQLEFLPDTQEIGRGVVIGQSGAEALLEANKVAYFDRFVQRPQFAALYPQSLSPAQFIDALNTNTAHSLTAQERDALVNELSAGTKTRAQALRAVAENAVFRQREFNRAFVLMQYSGYLRRNPNDAPEPNLDFSGYNFWLAKLNQFGGNFVQAEMVKAFITSGEYKSRFGPS